ncbi:MAG: hypothetical protein ACLSHG_10845 [Oscillospiraceae bacterium]
MYSASDYRGMARRALKNYWWLAVGVTLLASILGGTSSSFTPSFSLTINGDDLTQYYPEASAPRAAGVSPVSGVISLVQFVIGGSVSIGHNRFCLKLVDGEQAQFEDLFSGFDIFGNAFVAQPAHHAQGDRMVAAVSSFPASSPPTATPWRRTSWPKIRACRPRRPSSAPRRSWTGTRATCSALT